MIPLRLAAIQFESKLGRQAGNMRRAERAIREAAGAGAQLVCLPESILTGGDILEVANVAAIIPGSETDQIASLSSELRVYIVAGLLERGNDGCYSTSILIGPSEGLIGTYRRVHCHELERRYLSCGEEFPMFDLAIGRIGLLQGYDLNFPEATRAYFSQNVDIIVCSALIPSTYAHVANMRIPVRAMDSECIIVFASGVGTNLYAGFSYMGRSQIVANPLFLDAERFDFMDGEERMAMLDDGEGTIYADVDIERQRRYYLGASLRPDLRSAAYATQPLQGMTQQGSMNLMATSPNEG